MFSKAHVSKLEKVNDFHLYIYIYMEGDEGRVEKRE
jgi:hypothetical protein